ncbi:MAG: hypothetical protein U1F68_12565 [Gammaproteobacteria bacterium]
MGGLAVVIAATFAMDALLFAPTAVAVARILAYLAVAALLSGMLVVPLARRVPLNRAALYLEEHEPALQAAVMSAVEARQAKPGEVSPGLARRLAEHAAAAARAIDHGRRVDRHELRQAAVRLAGVAALCALVFTWHPSFLGRGLPFLFPWSQAAVNPYAVSVTPGDARIARGTDQLIAARLQGFDAERVELWVKRSAADWRRVAMAPGAEPRAHEAFLFDLDQAVDYYVAAGGVRSPTYHIAVIEFPTARELTLEYHFPEYTGLPPRTDEQHGDISAVRGTRVRLQVRPSIPVKGGDIVLDGTERIALKPEADGALTAEMEVRDDGTYRIDLQAEQGDKVAASPDYAIEAVEDQEPEVAISQPGRDIKVTRVEEPAIEVKATDDLGLDRVELALSVNGGPEQIVPLKPVGGNDQETDVTHTVYLEELGLQPGDLIAYHARAFDKANAGAGQEAKTDMYFLEVRPFRRDYREAESQGSQGGEPDDQRSLSAQQRELVVATFNTLRDRASYRPEAYDENLSALAQAEARIRNRVEALVNRLGTRDILQLQEGYRKMAEELPKAAEAMRQAEQHLQTRAADAALAPAQIALQHLQRAEAAFREVQVAQNDQAGRGRGDADEDLENLFRLELDKLRNQYENIQHGREQDAAQAELDKVLEKLRELARRQQQEVERQGQRAAQRQNQSGGGGSNQRSLAEEAEELARQLERLSRKQQTPEVQATLDQLKQAAAAMRRAADNDATQAEARNALERLQQAKRQLDQNRSSQLARDIDAARKRAEDLYRQQREVVKNVSKLSDDESKRAEQLDGLRQRKEQMADEVKNLETELDKLARAAQAEQQADSAAKLKDAANGLRRDELADRIRASQRSIEERMQEFATALEGQIGVRLYELQKKVAEAGAAVGESQEQRLAHSLEEMRELTRNLEALQQRIARRAEQQGQAERQAQQQNPQAGQQQGQQQGQQERQGQQAGQQAQQGQPGQQAQQGQEGQPGQQQGQQAQQAQTDQQGQQDAQPNARDNAAQGGRGYSRYDREGRIGRWDPADIQALQGEFNRQRSEAERIGQALNEAGERNDDIQAVMQRLQALENQTAYADPEQLARLQADAIERLKQLEFKLRKGASENTEQRLSSTAEGEAPEGYRALVEEYYRTLSRETRKP